MTRVGRFRLRAFVQLGLALLGVTTGGACVPATDGPPRNAIIVLVDTLRADHLSSYGYERDTSPELDAFAAASLRFSDVRSQAACTAPSVNSLLTSRHPLRFLDQESGHIGIPRGIASVAEILKRHDYWTLAISASPIVRKTPSKHNRFGEFDRGFDVFDEECFMSNAACVNRKAFDALEALPEPFLLFLHYMDPHSPYSPPASFARDYSASLRGDARQPLALREGRPQRVQRMAERGDLVLDEGVVGGLTDLYDDEIRYFDSQLGRLLREFERRDWWDRTMLVIASDHGEAFLEQGYLGHCRTPLFESMTATPLLMRIPGVRRTEPVTIPAENLDIVPTILDYLGVDASELGLEGRSLRAAIEDRDEPRRVTFTGQSLELAVSRAEFTLSYDMESKQHALYDRVADPEHLRDLSTSEPELVAELERELHGWLARAGQSGTNLVDSARQLESELRALGYVE